MKQLLYFIGILTILLIAGAGVFFYKNLRGTGPAVLPAAKNSVKESSGLPTSIKNTTGLPLVLPEGFSISTFASNLVGPRVLQFDPNGVLLVSITGQGKVVALPDKNSDGEADDTIIVASGLNNPHGIAFHPGTKKLYIAETNQVVEYDYDQATHKATNKKKVVDLPGGGNHVTRTIGFGPDGRFYISIGSSCNVCVEEDDRRAAVLVADVTGRDPITLEVYAFGLRNSVFFAWHPVTKDMWATEMGRDLIGDDIPPDEINIIKDDENYGWPYCYGKSVRDTTFSDPNGLSLFGFQGLTLAEVCQRVTPSYIDLPAHSAPLGLAFIPSESLRRSESSNTPEAEGVNKIAAAMKMTPTNLWPEEYRGDLLVAYHGSWNRSTPTGYKIVRIKLDEKGQPVGLNPGDLGSTLAVTIEDFITGWLGNASAAAGALGRPVDLLFGPDGSLYISDDKAGVIYQVSPPK